MIWQDIVVGTGTIVFLISLMPTLMNKNAKVPLLTSLPTAIVLYVFSLTFLTLRLYFSSSIQFLTATAWLMISIFRHTWK